MRTLTVLGVLAGGFAALGVLLLDAARRTAHPTFVERVAPYVAATGPTRRRGVLSRTTAVLAQDVSRWLEHLGSSGPSVRRRLAQLGHGTPEAFRIEQLLWGGVGLGVGVLLALGVGLTRGVEPLPLAIAVALLALLGALARDQVLTLQARARTRRIAAELPTVAELLALAVGAGESPAAALDRISRTTQGELPSELTRTLGEVRAGRSLATALAGLAERIALPALTRFTDGIQVAIERGSPLAEVLRAQAADARASARTDLMESGGKREIAMLVPVVTLLLPLTVVFALFPGMSLIQSGLQ